MRRGPETHSIDCTYAVDATLTKLCGRPSSIHARFDVESPATACIEHEAALRAAPPAQVHAIGPNCQMPGSYWNVDENECVVPDDFLAPIEVEEREAVPV